MVGGRGESELAARGSKRPLGEAASTRDATEMKRWFRRPLGTGKLAVHSPSDSEAAGALSPRPGTSQNSRKVYYNAEKFAGGSLGPTRAMLDVRKQKLRQNRNTKLQSLNYARKEVKKLCADVSEMFEEWESTLLTHPAHPSMHVQTVSAEFNVKSAQL